MDTGKKKFFIGQAIEVEEAAKPVTDAEQEKIDEAVDSTKKVLDPEYSDVLSSQAFNLIRSKRYDEALIIFDRAIALNPSNTIAKKGRQKVEELLGGKASNREVANRADAQRLVNMDTKSKADEGTYFLDTDLEFGDIKMSEDCDLGLTNAIVDKAFFPNIELFWNIPQEYRLGEVVNISGKITGNMNPKTVSVYLGPPEKQMVYFASVQEGIFTIPVYFDEAGEFLFTIVPDEDKASAKATKIRVRDPDCEKIVDKKTDIPSNLTYKVSNGEPVFYWNDEINNLFRIEFSQKAQKVVFYVRDELRLAPPLKAFKNFSEGTAKVKIWAAKTENNALNRQTTWMSGEVRDIFVTNHVSRKGNTLAKIKITEDFVIGDTIEIRGESDEELAPEFLVIDRNGNLQQSKLSLSRNKFSGSFKPNKLGTHIVGIYNTNGNELFVSGVVPQGSLPLIPDYLDLDNPKQPIKQQKVAEDMIRYVNHERNTRKVPILKESKELNKLAQFRAEDMCSRRYFDNKNPDGSTADSYKLTYDIFGDVVEHIVEESDLRTAHEKIMRSPKYFANIVAQDFTHIGFGSCQKGDGSINSIIVQILEKPQIDFVEE